MNDNQIFLLILFVVVLFFIVCFKSRKKEDIIEGHTMTGRCLRYGRYCAGGWRPWYYGGGCRGWRNNNTCVQRAQPPIHGERNTRSGSHCPYGKWSTDALISSTSLATCSDYTICNDNEYASSQATDTSDRECSDLVGCSESMYQTEEKTTVVLNWPGSDLYGNYASSEGDDGNIMNTSDSTCSPRSLCTGSQYQVEAPRLQDPDQDWNAITNPYVSDNVCANLISCPRGVQEEAQLLKHESAPNEPWDAASNPYISNRICGSGGGNNMNEMSSCATATLEGDTEEERRVFCESIGDTCEYTPATQEGCSSSNETDTVCQAVNITGENEGERRESCTSAGDCNYTPATNGICSDNSVNPFSLTENNFQCEANEYYNKDQSQCVPLSPECSLWGQSVVGEGEHTYIEIPMENI